jgi:hypothetical protein
MLKITGDRPSSSLTILIEKRLLSGKKRSIVAILPLCCGAFSSPHTRTLAPGSIRRLLVLHTYLCTAFQEAFKHSLEQNRASEQPEHLASSTPPRLQWSHLASVAATVSRGLTLGIVLAISCACRRMASSVSVHPSQYILQFCRWEGQWMFEH